MSSTGCDKFNDLAQFPFRICGDKKIIFTGNFQKLFYTFGELVVKKSEANSVDANQETLEAGDAVVSSWLTATLFLQFGIYVAGDPMLITSYDDTSVSFIETV